MYGKLTMPHDDLPDRIEEISGSSLIFVNGINCAAHTVQLAIKDALRMIGDDNKNVIKLSRAVVKFIRKESTRNEVINRKIKTIFPVIDVETRWNSTFMMVSNLFK